MNIHDYRVFGDAVMNYSGSADALIWGIHYLQDTFSIIDFCFLIA